MFIPQESKTYLAFLEKVQKICRPLDFRLVGGAFSNLLTSQTMIASLDCKKRTLILKDHAYPTKKRSDGSIVDIDMICFTDNLKLIESVKQKLVEWEREDPIPHISLEPAAYASWKKKRNNLFQFVTGIDIDKKNKLYLIFDNISQEIPWSTMDSWTIVLENGVTLQTLNPYAHMLRYYMRMPSGLKPKDIQRMQKNIQPFVQKFLHGAKRQGFDYENEYAPWNTFILKLTTNQKQSVKIKRMLTYVYWQTIGTYLAHGKGMMHTVSTWGDIFTG